MPAGSPNRPSERTLGHARNSECEYYRREFWHERAILAEFPKVPTFSSISKPGKPAFLLVRRTAMAFCRVTAGGRYRFASRHGHATASVDHRCALPLSAYGRRFPSCKNAREKRPDAAGPGHVPTHLAGPDRSWPWVPGAEEFEGLARPGGREKDLALCRAPRTRLRSSRGASDRSRNSRSLTGPGSSRSEPTETFGSR